MSRLKAVPLSVWMILIGVAYVAFGLAARFSAHHQEDATWFVYLAERILDGSFDIYTRLDQPWAAPPLGMAFTYPPLMPLVLAPFVWLGHLAGLSPWGIATLIGLPWLICDVLLAAQIAGLAADWTGRRDARWRLIAYLLCLLTFVVPVSSGYMGHHESFLLLLILLAIRARSTLVAGVWWGLAIASKQPAAFALLPVFCLALGDAWRWRRPGVVRLIALMVPAVVIPLALIAPFWLRWPSEVTYSLVGVEARRILYGVNVPRLADELASRLAPASAPAINALLVRWTSPAFILLSAIYALAFAVRQTERGAGSEAGRASWQTPAVRVPLIAAMGAIFAAFLVLGKWSEMHYRFLPLMFLLILDLVERPDFPYVYVLFTLAAGLYAFADSLTGYWRLALFAVLTCYFVARSWARPVPVEATLAPAPAPPS
jgi:hypothetical protein